MRLDVTPYPDQGLGLLSYRNCKSGNKPKTSHKLQGHYGRHYGWMIFIQTLHATPKHKGNIRSGALRTQSYHLLWKCRPDTTLLSAYKFASERNAESEKICKKKSARTLWEDTVGD